jgi:anti-sigma-K factor RskA
MAEHPSPHPDLAGYLLGRLEPEEEESFRHHLATCATCRTQLEELSALPGLLEQAAAPFEVPDDLQAKTMAAIEREAAPARRPERARLLRVGAAVSVAAALVVALVLGIQIGRSQRPPLSAPVQGDLEMQEVLRNPSNPSRTGFAEVRHVGTERVVYFRSSELGRLPRGEYYELWFVGPGDARAKPNRVSAGTFTPDSRGRARIVLTVAIDPADYTIISVSVEPTNGNPAREGPDVMRSDVYRQ